jgi:hypothetical protein
LEKKVSAGKNFLPEKNFGEKKFPAVAGELEGRRGRELKRNGCRAGNCNGTGVSWELQRNGCQWSVAWRSDHSSRRRDVFYLGVKAKAISPARNGAGEVGAA